MLFLPMLIARFTHHSAAADGQLTRELIEKGTRIAQSQREQVQALRAAGVGPWAVTKPTAHAHTHRRRRPTALTGAASVGRRRNSN